MKMGIMSSSTLRKNILSFIKDFYVNERTLSHVAAS